MTIRTPRLALVPASPEYLDSTHAYASDGENCRYMMFLPKDSLEETRQFLADAAAEWEKPEPDYWEFMILMDGRHVGGVTLNRLKDAPHSAELGWILHRDFQHRGIAAEAVRALMDCARREWGFTRFIAQCDSENEPSWRLMEKLGMRCIDRSGKRKNRGSEEQRVEWTYEILFEN